VVKTRTAKDRFRRALVNIAQWCKLHRHAPVLDQQQMLNAKLRGHYGYDRRIGNAERLWDLWNAAKEIGWRWLSRRSVAACP
jgi:hypothetical protein